MVSRMVSYMVSRMVSHMGSRLVSRMGSCMVARMVSRMVSSNGIKHIVMHVAPHAVTWYRMVSHGLT